MLWFLLGVGVVSFVGVLLYAIEIIIDFIIKHID